MDFFQGDCVQLASGEQLFQVIGINDGHSKCWIRRWPLLPQGSPVFEVPITQIVCSSREVDNKVRSSFDS